MGNIIKGICQKQIPFLFIVFKIPYLVSLIIVIVATLVGNIKT